MKMKFGVLALFAALIGALGSPLWTRNDGTQLSIGQNSGGSGW